MLYYNYQPKLTKQINLEDMRPVPSTVNIYRALEITQSDLFLHTYQYKPDLDKILAFALTIGKNVTLRVDSIQEVIHIQKYDTIKPLHYRNYNKDRVYNYLRETLKPYSVDMMRVDSEVQYLREKNCGNAKRFQLTEEVENFIRTYAPAYGIPLPRFHELEMQVTSHLPKKYYKAYNDIYERNQNPERALAKWDDKEAQSRRATPLHEIERIFQSLMFYVRNDIPYNDNYTACPICGKPMRKNSYGLTEFTEFEVCPDCDPNPCRGESSYISFNEAYMDDDDDCGHKVPVRKAK